MATLQKIRNRAGILIAIVIGIALLAFILGDFMTTGNVSISNNKMTIAKINGVSVHVKEFDKIMQSISSAYQNLSGRSFNDDNAIQEIRNQAWEELKNTYGSEATVELIAGSGGVYEVTVDGKNIFSKKKLGRFPEDGEILKLVG